MPRNTLSFLLLHSFLNISHLIDIFFENAGTCIFCSFYLHIKPSPRLQLLYISYVGSQRLEWFISCRRIKLHLFMFISDVFYLFIFYIRCSFSNRLNSKWSTLSIVVWQDWFKNIEYLPICFKIISVLHQNLSGKAI